MNATTWRPFAGGFASANFNLGNANGNGVERDDGEARRLFARAARGGGPGRDQCPENARAAEAHRKAAERTGRPIDDRLRPDMNIQAHGRAAQEARINDLADDF